MDHSLDTKKTTSPPLVHQGGSLADYLTKGPSAPTYHAHIGDIEKQNEGKEKQNGGQDRHRRFWLITYPRSASHLLVHMLNVEKQPNVQYRQRGGYFFLPLIPLRDYQLRARSKNVQDWPPEYRELVKQCFQNCFNELQDHLNTAQANGKIAFVKEHADFMTEPTAQSRFLFGQDSVKEPAWTVRMRGMNEEHVSRSSLNNTIFPDEFLKKWLPTFLIRHPALVFPSHYRANRDCEGPEIVKSHETALDMTLHWSRSLYDWYSEYLSNSPPPSDSGVTWPLVVDADDVMLEPEVILRLAEIVGLDPDKLQFAWTPASREEVESEHPVERRMRDTIDASSGILKSKTAVGLDIDVEARKWREEFGESEGARVEKWVRDAMPDYEFMRARRLRPREN